MCTCAPGLLQCEQTLEILVLGNRIWTRPTKEEKNEIDLLINSQQMVLSVILHAGAVPLSLEDQVHYYPSSSTTFQSSTIFQSSSPASPEYVQHLEELVGELSGVFATFIHQNPPPSSPTSLADMYHQRINTCRSSPSGK
jgi:hypothetical protein